MKYVFVPQSFNVLPSTLPSDMGFKETDFADVGTLLNTLSADDVSFHIGCNVFWNQFIPKSIRESFDNVINDSYGELLTSQELDNNPRYKHLRDCVLGLKVGESKFQMAANQRLVSSLISEDLIKITVADVDPMEQYDLNDTLIQQLHAVMTFPEIAKLPVFRDFLLNQARVRGVSL